MIRVEVSQAPVDQSVLEPLLKLGGGAVVSFTGIARADSGVRGPITAIELEHYPAMTQISLEALVSQAVRRWSLLGCVLIHRVGRVETGEAIVLVGTAASHRAEALEACTFLIDRLKTDAPFWKKEHRADGSSDWVVAKESDGQRSDAWL